MDWMQFATFMIGNMVFTLTLWLWSRSESRADHRNLEASQRNLEKAVEASQRNLEIAVNTQLIAIREEMRDFHGRLCAIEERNRK